MFCSMFKYALGGTYLERQRRNKVWQVFVEIVVLS